MEQPVLQQSAPDQRQNQPLVADDAVEFRPNSSERRCLVTGQTLPKEQLLRFVMGPDHLVVFDVSGRLPGRGMWISSNLQTLEQACSKRTFLKASKGQAKVPADLTEQVKIVLLSNCLNLLRLARRSGKTIHGFEKVRDYLTNHQPSLVLQAHDGENHLRLPSQIKFSQALTADELGQVFDASRVVHVAITDYNFAQRIHQELLRFSGFRWFHG